MIRSGWRRNLAAANPARATSRARHWKLAALLVIGAGLARAWADAPVRGDGPPAAAQVETVSKVQTGSIQGTITYGGYLLPNGKVSLHPTGSSPISADLDGGSFKLGRVPVGTLRVSIDAEGISKRYAVPDSSGLSIRVKKGPNTIVLNLPTEGIEVGQKAPHILAYGPDGNVMMESHLRGKVVLLAFWFIQSQGAASDAQFALLRKIRREFSRNEKFQMISLCVDVLEGEEDAVDAWNQFVTEPKPVDYGDGKRRFIDDSKWWQCTGIPGVSVLPSAPRYGVTREPQLFLIGPDGRFAAVRIPENQLREEIQKALGPAE